jgi:hypothetical protein
MGSLPKAPDPDNPEPVFQYTVPFNTSLKPSDFHILYGVKEDGTLIWHRHVINPGSRRPHSWNPPQRVGDGWRTGLQNIYPAGQNGIYTLDDNGNLKWFWHTGVLDGSYRWREPSQLVGTGWNSFTKIIPMDRGVIYGILPDGTLRWHKHLNYMTGLGGTGDGAWAKAKIVHSGFDKYRTVFGGGNGVLYAVGNDGKLYWYRHKDYLDNPAVAPINLPRGLNANTIAALRNIWNRSWEGPKVVGDGWDTPTKLFSPGEGHIYAVMPNGDLMYYRHTGWQNGTYVWDENIKAKIATGWNAYAMAFARNAQVMPVAVTPKLILCSPSENTSEALSVCASTNFYTANYCMRRWRKSLLISSSAACNACALCGFRNTGANKSPLAFRRFVKFLSANFCGSGPLSTSFHSSGVATVAPGRARTE